MKTSQFYFLFLAWLRSTKETSVEITITDGKTVAVDRAPIAGNVVADIEGIVRDIEVSGVVGITVHSMTSMHKGKPEVVYHGIVFNEAKRAVAEYK